MDTMVIFILALGVQVYVCVKGEKLLGKLLPLLVSLVVEAAGWLCVLIPDPGAGWAWTVVGTIILGMYLLGGTTLGWFIYGVIQAVKKCIRR